MIARTKRRWRHEKAEPEVLPFFPQPPCTPIKCKRCGFTYHWRGKVFEVVRLRPVEEGLCPACWSGRLPAVHGRPCPVCNPEAFKKAPANASRQ